MRPYTSIYLSLSTQQDYIPMAYFKIRYLHCERMLNQDIDMKSAYMTCIPDKPHAVSPAGCPMINTSSNELRVLIKYQAWTHCCKTDIKHFIFTAIVSWHYPMLEWFSNSQSAMDSVTFILKCENEYRLHFSNSCTFIRSIKWIKPWWCQVPRQLCLQEYHIYIAYLWHTYLHLHFLPETMANIYLLVVLS